MMNVFLEPLVHDLELAFWKGLKSLIHTLQIKFPQSCLQMTLFILRDYEQYNIIAWKSRCIIIGWYTQKIDIKLDIHRDFETLQVFPKKFKICKASRFEINVLLLFPSYGDYISCMGLICLWI
jgi:hypothetical protein